MIYAHSLILQNNEIMYMKMMESIFPYYGVFQVDTPSVMSKIDKTLLCICTSIISLNRSNTSQYSHENLDPHVILYLLIA